MDGWMDGWMDGSIFLSFLVPSVFLNTQFALFKLQDTIKPCSLSVTKLFFKCIMAIICPNFPVLTC